MIIEKIRYITPCFRKWMPPFDRCTGKSAVCQALRKGATVHHQHESCSVLDVVLSGKLVAYSLWKTVPDYNVRVSKTVHYRSQFAV